MKKKNHYDSLGVARDAPVEVIRAAYKAMAQKNHPDKNVGNPAAVGLMQDINQAYDVLSDPEKRSVYDFELGEQERKEQAQLPVRSASRAPATVRHPSPAAPAAPSYSQPHYQPPPPRQPVQAPRSIFVLAQLVAGLVAVALLYASYMYNAPVPRVPELPHTVQKNAPPQNPAETSPKELAECIFAAAKTYQVPAQMLLGILSVEDGAVGTKTPAPGNTFDVGPMQINTAWAPQLAQFWEMPPGAALHMMSNDACTNIGVGAWILHGALEKSATLPQGLSAYYLEVRRATHLYDRTYAGKVLQKTEMYRQIRSPADLLEKAPAAVDK